MSLLASLTIAQLNPDGSVPVPEAPDAQAQAAAAALERQAQWEAMQAQMKELQAVLAMPLKDILAEHDKLKKCCRLGCLRRHVDAGPARHAPRGHGLGGQTGRE